MSAIAPVALVTVTLTTLVCVYTAGTFDKTAAGAIVSTVRI